MGKAPTVWTRTITMPKGGSVEIPEGWVIIEGWDLANGGLYLIIRQERVPVETVTKARFDRERRARKAAEKVNADEVMARHTNSAIRIEVLEEENRDLALQNERARKALGDHERDREAQVRIEAKVDELLRLAGTTDVWCDDCQRRVVDCVCP